MEALFLRVVWISLTCSAVLVPLLVGKGWLRQHVRAKALYVVWLILALRLVIPVDLSLPEPAVTVEAPSYQVASQLVRHPPICRWSPNRVAIGCGRTDGARGGFGGPNHSRHRSAVRPVALWRAGGGPGAGRRVFAGPPAAAARRPA